MKKMRRLYRYIKEKIGFGKRRAQKRPVSTLDPAILEQALAEARFLHQQYGVDVRRLQPGETPSDPKPVE
ncbi:MAG: hypothetical protein SFT92_07165 [Rickettsiales bacterium]|nr:hypothetical protein [Rickettsiales bacterium]